MIDFTIIALCVFMLVKGINKLSRKKQAAPAAPPAPPAPSAEEKLLAEIRDLLKQKDRPGAAPWGRERLIAEAYAPVG